MKILKFLTCMIALNSSYASAECSAEIIDKFPNAQLIVFGELHGTKEIPQFFQECINGFLHQKIKIKVFLEFPASENALVQRYLKQGMPEADLLLGKHWHIKDGRSSAEMLKIFQMARQNKGDIDIYGFDAEDSELNREQSMAENIRDHYDSTAVNLILTGNLHAKLDRGSELDPNFESFTFLLRRMGVKLTSLDASYDAGFAWVCTPQCGELKIGANVDDGTKAAGRLTVFRGDPHSYDGKFFVGAISSSPPAISVWSR